MARMIATILSLASLLAASYSPSWGWAGIAPASLALPLLAGGGVWSAVVVQGEVQIILTADERKIMIRDVAILHGDVTR